MGFSSSGCCFPKKKAAPLKHQANTLYNREVSYRECCSNNLHEKYSSYIIIYALILLACKK